MSFLRYLLFIGILNLFNNSYCQRFEFGVFGGGSQFYGDLNYSLYTSISHSEHYGYQGWNIDD